MECPIKVNRHKGGKVTSICVAQLAVVFRAAWVQIPSEPEILSVFFSAVGKIAARLRRSMLFFFILHRQLQRNHYFLQIHNLNLRKEENLCFDNILFVNDWRIINKISLSDLTKFPQSGKGRWECLFRAFIVWKKVWIDYLFSNDFLR